MALSGPVENKKRAVIRAVAEAGVGLLPIAGALARLYQTTHPSRFQMDLELWYGDITATVNALDARVAALEAEHHPQLQLSDLAVEIALWFCRRDETERPYPASFDQLSAAFPDERPDLVAEAAYELEDVELVHVTAVVGDGGNRVSETWALAWLFQPVATDVSPMADAGELARLALESDYLDAQDIHESQDWSPRRVNAAMEIIATFASPGLVSRPSHPVFSAYGITIDHRARRRLRAFIGLPAGPGTAT